MNRIATGIAGAAVLGLASFAPAGAISPGDEQTSPYQAWPDNVPARQIITEATIDQRAERFTRDFRRIGIAGEISSCRSMVQLPVVTSRQGNRSYGAVCVAQFGSTRQVILVCDDDMVGHFAFSTSLSGIDIGQYSGRDTVAWFTLRNCYGG